MRNWLLHFERCSACDYPPLISAFPFVSSQVDKLEEAESQRKTEEEVTEPQAMVFGRFTQRKEKKKTFVDFEGTFLSLYTASLACLMGKRLLCLNINQRLQIGSLIFSPDRKLISLCVFVLSLEK